MKVVILAGGYGTRISEESHLRPKPMIEIGSKPILWHIMKEYLFYGFDDFIICAGYMQHIIKEWFANYSIYNSDIRFSFKDGKGEATILSRHYEPWNVTVVDTGLDTQTGGRIKRIRDYIGEETFMLTYGDGVCDINLRNLLDYHKKNGKYATITAVNMMQNKGVLDITGDNLISSFREKGEKDGFRINGGYMVLEPEVFDYLEGDSTVFEREPMERLSADKQLLAYKHNGFWQCMDTIREKEQLEKMCKSGNAPWMVWEE